MPKVIDANVFAAFYQEFVLEDDPPLTAPATPIVQSLSIEEPGFIDDNGWIEYEWSNKAETEWFEGWLARSLQAGTVERIEAENDEVLRRRLRDVGFPVDTRDIWYIRTARAVSGTDQTVTLVSEDMHFFSPTEKEASGPRKRRLLVHRTGPVVNVAEEWSIYIHSTHSFLERGG